MEQVVAEYGKILNALPERIERSGIQTQKFMSLLGVPRTTFYRKLKKNNFSFEEVRLLSKILAKEDALLKLLEEGEQCVSEGKYKPLENI